MNVTFSSLLVIFSCSFTICPFYQMSAARENFRIITGETEVEKLAVKRATQKTGLFRTITTTLKRLTICERQPEVKVEFCRQFLPMADLGLKFEYLFNQNLTCEPKTFHIRHLVNEETDNYTVDMYSCPEIVYKDLETEENTSINHKYHVSNGWEYNSAIVFIQKNTDETEDKIYPRNYVKDIVFKKLVPPKPNEIMTTSRETPSQEHNSYSKVEDQAIAYEEAIQLNKPYEKFRRTFTSLNVCGLRKSYKVHLCRESIRVSYKWYAQLEHEDYDEYVCRKRRISVTTPDQEGVTKGKHLHSPTEAQVTLLLCPVIKDSALDTNNDFVYLSSNLLSRSVLLFTRKNKRGEPFVRRFLVNNLSVDKIATDQRRARFMLYPSAEEREEELRELPANVFKDFFERMNSLGGSVGTLRAIAKFGPTRSSKSFLLRRLVVTVQRKQLVEDTLISFSQVKATKLVYMRFKMMHWSLDICQQPKIVRRELCNNILRYDPYYYKMNLHETNIDYRCYKRTIHLKTREIENLQPMDFSMWQCPTPTTHVEYNFIIAKCHLKNAAFLLKTSRFHPDADIYADGLVTRIDREYLSLIKE